MLLESLGRLFVNLLTEQACTIADDVRGCGRAVEQIPAGADHTLSRPATLQPEGWVRV